VPVILDRDFREHLARCTVPPHVVARDERVQAGERRAVERFVFERLGGFQILQHRGFEVAQTAGEGQRLLERLETD